MITYLKKDITTVERGVLAHGVNCQRKMGSGVALAIKTKWPTIYTAYMDMPGGKEMLGGAHIINVSEDSSLHVANCYTQEFYGPGDKKYASPEAIMKALDGVFSFAQINELPVYLPKIGAGLGGLDWETEVLPIVQHLDEEFSDVDTFVCEI